MTHRIPKMIDFFFTVYKNEWKKQILMTKKQKKAAFTKTKR